MTEKTLYIEAYRHHVVINGQTKPYWAEATKAPKNPARVDGYAVFCKTVEAGRTCIQRFSLRGYGSDAALQEANKLRDKLNAATISDAEVDAYIAKLTRDDLAAGIE